MFFFNAARLYTQLPQATHSNRDLFPRSSLIFFEVRVARIIMVVDNRILLLL